MGWDTQINIIVENVIDEEIEIAKDLFNSDAKSYYRNGISFIKFKKLFNDGFTLVSFIFQNYIVNV